MRAIRSAKDAWAVANEEEVAENVRTTSMIARKSRSDMGICCGAVEDEPAKSAGDGALEATGAGGLDEAGFAIPEPEGVNLELEPPQPAQTRMAAHLGYGARLDHPQQHREAEDENSRAHSVLDPES